MSKGEGGFLSLALVVRERESRDFAAATPKASAGEQSDDFLSHVFFFRRLSNKREARMSEPMNSTGRWSAGWPWSLAQAVAPA